MGGYAAAAATCYLRMYNNKHWLSDVVAGAGVGILSTGLAYALYPFAKRLFSPHQHVSSTMILPAYLQGTVSLGAIHAF